MTEKLSAFETLTNGTAATHQHARNALPILVRWAESQRNLALPDLTEHTYIELARAIDPPTHQRVIPRALGLLGHALNDLSARAAWAYGRIPAIQLLVWSQGKGRPGDSGLTYLHRREEIESMDNAQKKTIAQTVWQDVVTYPYWQEVLKACNLVPTKSPLPSMSEAIRQVAEMKERGGESEAHKKLKAHVIKHYHLLGIKGDFETTTERMLLSADRTDVLLEERGGGNRIICIEVKSRLSPYGDLLRGIFQCVKYRAILRAHDTYLTAREGEPIAHRIDVMLVVEDQLPLDLQALSSDLAIPVRQVVVPV